MITRKDAYGTERTKYFFSLILFFETALVEFGGTLNATHINREDFELANEMEKEKLITLKRLPFEYVNGDNPRKCTHRVTFSDIAWTIAHKERRDRAERLIPQSIKITGSID